MTQTSTDVLVVGAGPFGVTTALALARQGVRVRLIAKAPWVANTPRAHITSQRTMEVFRDLGVEERAKQVATDWSQMGDSLLAVSLTGPEIARMPSWGSGFARHGDYVRNSPCGYLDIPQDRIEPVLIDAAGQSGVTITYHTELLDLAQDDDGVTATLRHRLSGTEEVVRCQYLVGADGAKSLVAEKIGLPFEGHVSRAGTLYTQFRCDLSTYVAHRPSILHWFFNPDLNVGEIGLGLLRCTKPWTEWIAGWGFLVEDGVPELTDDQVIDRIRELVGVPDLEIEIFDRSVWYVNQQYATEYTNGRVMCGGDATHRHPPSSGLGLNTCVQDAHNLAWKLAFLVKGYAGSGLLDSYAAERAPVGRQIVLRANQSRLDYAAIRDCLDVTGPADPVTNALTNLNAPTEEGIKLRAKLEDALQLKEYEFNAEGVEKNHRYSSSAVLPEPDAGEEVWERDQALYHQPTTRPGAKLPHAWLVDHHGHRSSTLDVVGRGRFTLVSGIAGVAWQQAAERLGLPYLDVVRVGADPDAQDPYHEWYRRRDIHEAGALLVRPDAVIAWRHREGVWSAEEAERRLSQALGAVLDRAVVGAE
ncbi:FAD-dependent oxidoreductase [Naumannella sp. ID2617S]|uniref:2,4-dichlorophenol 6-monooxygenase n=1 Tax=Enemella dayhoffiae TaxID=2016507 RepID=A0A255HE14_9ACTN|nr:FAD-dependent monooxygenase [Enemella dayhoffiae]NNG20121.1 FAD-dependent oxidoreductase [Naumannella sp. ID2617S]OYO25323.1 2,4-dichlorophenol 6-monooxygenase [Enemella dayhoffiae]